MKKLIALFSVVFLLTTVFPAFADDINGVGEIHANKLNVRTEPDTDADIIGALYDGEQIDIITKTNKTC